MDLIIKLYVRVQNWHHGQKLIKFALIRRAVALVMYPVYQTTGTGGYGGAGFGPVDV